MMFLTLLLAILPLVLPVGSSDTDDKPPTVLEELVSILIRIEDNVRPVFPSYFFHSGARDHMDIFFQTSLQHGIVSSPIPTPFRHQPTGYSSFLVSLRQN
ncbi:hypothetical protein B0T25DRAFT_541610 [Lasiosphaeria hispida]|uniref:Uncharacterized protein n=1 Tax=Lasiosphaeria hispida TaxID=260671 RepID=A0AAJ0HGL6_9PEZI|nr:hypothetical protein B0T25DRAFT_541610 [Lasiosphaeria hispida]